MKIKEYHYTECGLKNVYIEGLAVINDDGEDTIQIPNIQELHWLIAKDILESKSMNGDEIRFLRTEMGYTPERLSKKLSIASRTLKSIENGKTKIKEDIDLKLRQLGFSMLIVPKHRLYNTGAKRKTRRIEAVQPTPKSATYRFQEIA